MKYTMVSVCLANGLILITNMCASQQCKTHSNIEILHKGKIPTNDYKPLFTIEDSFFGKLFHKCFHFCGNYEQCMGFEICKLTGNVLRCNACCEWKKVKTYGTLTDLSTCTFYGRNIEFETNLALDKPTTLSSEFDEFHKSSNAVDGIKMCTTQGSVAASQYSTHPWLLIQLERPYQVKMVKVFARSDGYPHRLDNIVVLINDGRFNHTCGGQYPGTTEAFDAVLFLCASGAIGSNITVLKTTAGTDLLGLCEVEVFGTP